MHSNATLEERLRSQAVALTESLRAFAEATTDVRALLDTIARRMARTIGGCCVIALPSADGEWLEPVASFDDDPEALELLYRAFTTPAVAMRSLTLGASVMQTGKHFFAPALPAAEITKRYATADEQARALRLGIGSLLIIALRCEGVSIGILTVVRHGASVLPIDEDEIRLAQGLADHAALALTNARLFERMQRELDERTRVQQALNASEARLSRIVETAHEGIWVTDVNRCTTFVNRRMAEMLHEPAEQLVGRSALDFVLPEDRSASDARLERRRAGIAEQVEIRVRRHDGSILDVAMSASPLTDDAGTFIGTVKLLTDCSQRRAVEEQLRHAQRLDSIGQLAGGIAHDFNNLLSVILSFSELALEALPAEHPVRSDLGEIMKAGERANELTRQILAFGRKQRMQPHIIDANATLRSVAPMLQRLIGENIELSYSLDPALGRIKADPGQLEQVLVNLVVNARDAMPEGGKLTLETQNEELDGNFAQAHIEIVPGPHVMIAVTDTGHGMDKETQQRIFEPFFTTKEMSKGTGLGLATVFGIVKQSGGSIWLYSEPGRGTTFKLFFPRTHELEAAHAPQTMVPLLLTGSETILLVEDDEPVRSLVTLILQRAGYHPLVAASPAEAIALAAKSEYLDLLLTDVVMPGMDGETLARRLTAARPTLRVLYMSGYTGKTVVDQGGIDARASFLAKPITPEVLLRTVRAVLDGVPSSAFSSASASRE